MRKICKESPVEKHYVEDLFTSELINVFKNTDIIESNFKV